MYVVTCSEIQRNFKNLPDHNIIKKIKGKEIMRQLRVSCVITMKAVLSFLLQSSKDTC